MSGMQFDPQMIQQLLAMFKSQGADPFTRALPGEGLLGTSNGAGNGFNQHMPTSAPMSAMPNEQQTAPNATSTIPSDFANTQPGLPNLPDTFTGFGFGQFAPKEVQPMGVRQKLIQQLMKMSGNAMPGSGLQSSINGGFM